MDKLCLFQPGTRELEDYFPIRPDLQVDVPKTRFKLRPGKTLSARRWQAAFSEDGILDIASVLRRIQRGGVHPSIKGVVWEFLLGCFDPNSTSNERNELRQRRREQFAAWKAKCQKMVVVLGSGKYITAPIITDDGQPIEDPSDDSDSQDDNRALSKTIAPLDEKVIQWKRCLHQIGLDVVRTDRTLIFYENEANQAKLWDLLAIYAWMDNDIGYVQGMSDICSPMVVLLENEADAFWCFEHVMRRVVRLPFLNKEALDGGEYLFAFRMLMVLFRREFSFVDALYLWEVMWAMEYNPNLYASYREPSDPSAAVSKNVPIKINNKLLKQYGKFERAKMKGGSTDQKIALAVFLVASVLETKHKRFLKEAKGLDDVVRILGDMSGHLDAKKALKEALKVHSKYQSKVKKL